MAIVRPYRPNLAEMSVYRPFLDTFDVTFYFTGMSVEACRRELDSMGLQRLKATRYVSLPDFIPSELIRRILDYKIGIGSAMLSHLREVLQHDLINVVDPIYAFTFQIARSLRPAQKLIVVKWENLYGRYEKVWIAARFADRVLGRANHIICVSKAALHALRLPQVFAGKVVQIYPGIDSTSGSANGFDGNVLRLDRWRQGEAPTILFVGRLQWAKGLHTLLVAVHIVHSHFRLPCRLWVVGGGDQASFKRLAHELGIDAYVEFFGTMPRSQVRQKMREADLFSFPSLVSPTWTEQFGFALVEAMAHGLPVATTDSGSIREICGDDGLYSSTGNAYSLANNIAVLLLDWPAAVDRGRRLRGRSLQEFDADTQGKKMLEVIA